MRLIFGLVLLVGLGLAGFAVYMARGYIGAYQTALEDERAASATKVATSQVFVAARPIRYGAPLTPEDVRAVGWLGRRLWRPVMSEARQHLRRRRSKLRAPRPRRR